MRQIDNYIQEKLYIGSDYKVEKVDDFFSLKKYLENRGMILDDTDRYNGWYGISLRNGFEKYDCPNTGIKGYENGFNVSGFKYMDKKVVNIRIRRFSPNDYKEVPIDDFDLIENNGHTLIRYSTDNADKLLKLFKDIHEEIK